MFFILYSLKLLIVTYFYRHREKENASFNCEGFFQDCQLARVDRNTSLVFPENIVLLIYCLEY